MNPAFEANQVLTQLDKNSIANRGIPIETIEHQLAIFRCGIPFTTITRPCTISDGINQISDSEFPKLEKAFRKALGSGRVTIFVPASGAASRMFKSLLACCTEEPGSAPLPQSEKANLEKFLDRLLDFAFYEDLAKTLAIQGHNVEDLIAKKNFKPILETLLHPTGLNYAGRPKGLIAFHRYANHNRTPIEEHLLEAAAYAKAANNAAYVHFTILPKHVKAVQELIQSARQRFAQDDINWVVTFSLQKTSSDAIAVDMDNQPFRDQEGNLLFRPGGHGARNSGRDFGRHGDGRGSRGRRPSRRLDRRRRGGRWPTTGTRRPRSGSPPGPGGPGPGRHPDLDGHCRGHGRCLPRGPGTVTVRTAPRRGRS